MNNTLCIILLTYDRMEAAEPTLRAVLDKLHYSKGPIDLHIADDGSPVKYRKQLQKIAGGYPHLRHIGMTNAERAGYGRSYNLATQSVHLSADYVLPLEDDWFLARDLDLDPLIETLDAGLGIGCIRLGYLGFTQPLRGDVIHSPAGAMLVFDPSSAERHVSAGHPRIETVAWERAVGPWTEGIAAGATEFEWCGRPPARHSVAWPLELVHPSGNLFEHIGARGLGEIEPERKVSG